MREYWYCQTTCSLRLLNGGFFGTINCLNGRDLLKQYVFFTDQASLALVMDEFAADFTELPVEMNYPIHLSPDLYPEAVRGAKAKILHYHDAVNPTTGGLQYCTDGCQDEAIEMINNQIMGYEEIRRGPVFWDYFYSVPERMHEEKNFRSYRRRLLALIVGRCKPKSILDFGCGVHPLGSEVPCEEYMGVDFSHEAIIGAKREMQTGRFIVSDIRHCNECQAELVVLTDVLPYTRSLEEYNKIIEHAIASSTDWLLVSGLSARPDREGWIATEYYENIEETLRRYDKMNFVKIGSAAGQEFFLGETA